MSWRSDVAANPPWYESVAKHPPKRNSLKFTKIIQNRSFGFVLPGTSGVGSLVLDTSVARKPEGNSSAWAALPQWEKAAYQNCCLGHSPKSFLGILGSFAHVKFVRFCTSDVFICARWVVVFCLAYVLPQSRQSHLARVILPESRRRRRHFPCPRSLATTSHHATPPQDWKSLASALSTLLGTSPWRRARCGLVAGLWLCWKDVEKRTISWGSKDFERGADYKRRVNLARRIARIRYIMRLKETKATQGGVEPPHSVLVKHVRAPEGLIARKDDALSRWRLGPYHLKIKLFPSYNRRCSPGKVDGPKL